MIKMRSHDKKEHLMQEHLSELFACSEAEE